MTEADKLASEYTKLLMPSLIDRLDETGVAYNAAFLRALAADSFITGYHVRDAEVAKLRRLLEELAMPHGYTNDDSPEDIIACMDEDAEMIREALK